MSYLSRVDAQGLYHVVSRGNNRATIFKDDNDFEKYLLLVQSYKKKYAFDLYAYCLMNNHVHLLIETDREGILSKAMQGLNLSYALWFKVRYNWVGHLWQGRFKSYIVDKEKYLWACVRYIALNPVKAGIVSKPEEYRWSSYRFLLERRPTDLIDWKKLGERLELNVTVSDVEAYQKQVLYELISETIPETF